jgi:hypothetical protein
MSEPKQFVNLEAGTTVPVDHLCGWGAKNEDGSHDAVKTQLLVREAFDLWGNEPGSIYQPLKIVGASGPPQAGQRSMLWEVSRKVIGTDPLNYAQEVGDCVSFGAKNAIEYVQFYPLANGKRNKWTMVFPPYLWGTGRIFIGRNQLGRQDGSMGSWQAEAVMKYGTIPYKYEGVPEYSGQVARQWGNSPGPDQKWQDLGKQYIVKSAALVSSWEDLIAALVNGYPVTIASDVGFDMTPRSDGFNHYSTSWGHQMCIIGVDDDASQPYACILNSWGDVHGQIKDFKTGDIWPKGTLRVLKKDIMTILNAGESFAYSAFDGFPAQELNRDLFDVW